MRPTDNPQRGESRREERVWLSALVALALGFLLLGLWTLRSPLPGPEPYRGDGSLVDHGPGSSPRYSLSLPPISLSQCGRHLFSLRGLPHATWKFSLEIPVDPLLPEAVWGDTEVQVLFVPRTPGAVFACRSPLKSWVKLRLEQGIELLPPALEAMPLEREFDYELSIQVEPKGRAEGNLIAVPRLEAGK